jgi:hypothetical protein
MIKKEYVMASVLCGIQVGAGVEEEWCDDATAFNYYKVQNN